MATPDTKVVDGIEEIMIPEEYKSVLEILGKYESMPFLELRSLVDMDNERLGRILQDLEGKGVVKITDRGTLLDEIVTLRPANVVLVSTAH
jgi:hypothetical protein